MAKRKRPAAPATDTSPVHKAGPRKTESLEVWSKSKKKRMRRLRAKQNNKSNDTGNAGRNSNDVRPKTVAIKSRDLASSHKSEPGSNSQSKPEKTSSLQQSFLARLSGSRFRELNEELYTTTSSSAFTRFSARPELYDQYHEGFRHQVEQWPVNPVNVICKWLVSKYGKQPCTVADFGCGDAQLAKKLSCIRHEGKCPFDVHSFDLVASSDLVTACDMANVPMDDKSVDVGVFCLSLMGTNLADFVREAHRVLKEDGRLKIAEVRSRFATAGSDELQDFVKVLDKLGFSSVKIDKSNKMFVLLEFEKNGKEPDPEVSFTAKPCIYKRR